MTEQKNTTNADESPKADPVRLSAVLGSALGEIGVRDRQFPCKDYTYKPLQFDSDAECETDGHYMCDSCSHNEMKLKGLGKYESASA
jgi:hypothetical protein